MSTDEKIKTFILKWKDSDIPEINIFIIILESFIKNKKIILESKNDIQSALNLIDLTFDSITAHKFHISKNIDEHNKEILKSSIKNFIDLVLS